MPERVNEVVTVGLGVAGGAGLELGEAGGLTVALKVGETGGLTGGGLGLGLEVVGLLVALVFRLGDGLAGVVVVGGGDEVVAGAVAAGAVVARDGLGLGSGERVRTGVRDGDGDDATLGAGAAGTRYLRRPGCSAGVGAGAPLTVPGSFAATAAAVTTSWRLATVAADKPITATAATAIATTEARRGRCFCRTSGTGGGGGGVHSGMRVWVASGSRPL